MFNLKVSVDVYSPPNVQETRCVGWDSNPRFKAYETFEITTSLPRNIF